MTRIDAFLKLVEYDVQLKNVMLTPDQPQGLSVSLVLDYAFQITDAELAKAKEIWDEHQKNEWIRPYFFSIGYLKMASVEFVEYVFQFFAASAKRAVPPKWMATDYSDEKPEYNFDDL